ncbi:MAG: 2-oxoacid:acceptor oxidoreductase family protein [Sphaerochaetaceae bacterium]
MKQLYAKANSFYDTFERKGPQEKTTHYCPGCGHGIIQKLIGAAIDELGIQDRVIFLSPVGCAVFSYYYYDTAHVQCSHGRAPAVATGIKRVHPEAIVISYQGDGDLAAIGMTEIVHAANRGEPITVFFINNAIYGMTGGQMAPTTPIGTKTITTPFGRDQRRDGMPIGMVELLSTLAAPVFIQRCSVATAKELLKTKKAIRKALVNQMEHAGFSFVEILSPCPTNWGMDPVESLHWIDTQMSQIFPLGVFRDQLQPSKKESPADAIDDQQLLALLQGTQEITILRKAQLPVTQKIIVAGFGGQGVLSAGELLATCALAEDLHASWLPSYGPEMRGGSAHVHVTLSHSLVGSPVIDHPNVLLALNGPSLEQFEQAAAEGALIILNSSLISSEPTRTDVTVVKVPATAIAQESGLASGANVAMVVAYLWTSGLLSLSTLTYAIPLALRKKSLLEKNIAIVEKTITYLQGV